MGESVNGIRESFYSDIIYDYQCRYEGKREKSWRSAPEADRPGPHQRAAGCGHEGAPGLGQGAADKRDSGEGPEGALAT